MRNVGYRWALEALSLRTCSTERWLTFYQGRTTFVNTLCGKRVLQSKDADDPTHAHLEEGVRIKPITVGMGALDPLALSLTVSRIVALTWACCRARAR